MTDPVRAVLFDLDGTLTDTNYGHAIAWSRAFRQEGHQVTMAAIHRHIGMGSDRLLDALLPGRDRARDDVLTAAHTEHYASFIGLIEPLPGARELCARSRGAEPGSCWRPRLRRPSCVPCVPPSTLRTA